MVSRLTTIGFDADDTLWQNETFYRLTQDRFAELLADHAEADHLHARLLEAERRNLGHYGFGIKGFMLSMIETAIEVTGGRVPASVIGEILAAGQEMLRHPIELPAAMRATWSKGLPPPTCLVLITKGDLLDQERKAGPIRAGRDVRRRRDSSRTRPRTRPTRPAFAPAMATGPTGAMMVGNSM